MKSTVLPVAQLTDYAHAIAHFLAMLSETDLAFVMQAIVKELRP